MIVTEELSSREWKCFLQLARRKREENRISLPRLERRPSSGVRQREENRTFLPP